MRRPLIQTVMGPAQRRSSHRPAPEVPAARTRFSGTQRGVGRVSPQIHEPLGHYAADAGRARAAEPSHRLVVSVEPESDLDEKQAGG